MVTAKMARATPFRKAHLDARWEAARLAMHRRLDRLATRYQVRDRIYQNAARRAADQMSRVTERVARMMERAS